MSEHIAGEDLAAFVDGTLQGKEKAGIESHLSRCPECLEALTEIVEIRSRPVKIPSDFLRSALKVPDEGTLGEKEAPARTALPMRLAFGIAAVFLVVVVLGYFILGGGRSRRARFPLEGRDDRPLAEALSPEPAKAEESGRAPAALPEPARAKKAKSGAGEIMSTAKSAPVAQAEAVLKPAAAPQDKATLRMADEVAKDRRQEAEAAVGGVQAPAEKDRLGETKLAASGAAGVPARVEEYQSADAKMLRSRPAGPAAADGALQLFLAATGRAAAPLGLRIAALAPGPFIRIEGDVSPADLRDPGVLREWTWFRRGTALELAIGPDGSVTAVSLIGTWDRRAGALAEEASGKLLFSPSRKSSRRAVLTADDVPL